MKIKRFIASGELQNPQTIQTTKEVIEQAGRMLEKSCTEQIVGTVLFEGEDGKFYTGTVEFCVTEASEEFVRDTIAEQEEQG